MTHAYAEGGEEARRAMSSSTTGCSNCTRGAEAAAGTSSPRRAPITAEHVVNAGGLWAKQVGRMVGVELPVSPMEHHYLVTEAIPEIAALGGARCR